MYDTFSSFGNILSCKVAQDGEGNSKVGSTYIQQIVISYFCSHKVPWKLSCSNTAFYFYLRKLSWNYGKFAIIALV